MLSLKNIKRSYLLKYLTFLNRLFSTFHSLTIYSAWVLWLTQKFYHFFIHMQRLAKREFQPMKEQEKLQLTNQEQSIWLSAKLCSYLQTNNKVVHKNSPKGEIILFYILSLIGSGFYYTLLNSLIHFCFICSVGVNDI